VTASGQLFRNGHKANLRRANLWWEILGQDKKTHGQPSDLEIKRRSFRARR
jgi:hypothetical protein